MTSRALLVVAAASALCACAGPKAAANADADAFVALKFAEGAAKEAAAPPADANAFLVDLWFERADGKRLAAPSLVAPAGQTAEIKVVAERPYVAEYAPPDFGKSEATPVTKTVEDGVRVTLCARRAPDGGVVLAYRGRLMRVREPIAETTTGSGDEERRTVQVPRQDLVDFEGARWLEPGVRGMLARVPSPDGSGAMLVLARAVPVRVDPPPEPPAGGDFMPASDFARPMSGHTLHLRVSAVEVGRAFEPGTTLDETATPDVMDAAGGRVLRDFEAFTCLDGRVRLAATFGTSDGKEASFAAAGTDAGRVEISWNGRTASVRANPGRRFVAVAPVEGGGTAGVLVSVDADD